MKPQPGSRKFEYEFWWSAASGAADGCAMEDGGAKNELQIRDIIFNLKFSEFPAVVVQASSHAPTTRNQRLEIFLTLGSCVWASFVAPGWCVRPEKSQDEPSMICDDGGFFDLSKLVAYTYHAYIIAFWLGSEAEMLAYLCTNDLFSATTGGKGFLIESDFSSCSFGRWWQVNTNLGCWIDKNSKPPS